MQLNDSQQEKLNTLLTWLKCWLAAEHLATLRPKLEFQTGILAGFALTASVLLGVTNCSTQGSIQQRLNEDLKHSLSEVVPATLYDNNMLEDTINIASTPYNIGAADTLVYRARKAGEITAVAFKFTAPDGYSGAIDMMIGIDKDGKILGVRVLNHKETPGLGDKIELAKSNWILSFNGFSLDNLSSEKWAVKKDGGQFDQFAGATITPRKSVQATYRSLQLFKDQKAVLLK
jgi:Na+-translocating ferredoxin:NAD+ oxidoreductase subunit G